MPEDSRTHSTALISPPGGEVGAAELAAAVLRREARRGAESGAEPQAVVPDEQLPGVPGHSLSLRQVLGAGGAGMVGVLASINLLDNIERGVVQVLSPDIQRTLGLSDLQLGAILALDAVMLIPATLGLGFLADRLHRTRLVGVLAVLDALFVMFTGLARNYWQFAVGRTGTGTGQIGLHSVHNALLSDRYPLQGRSRIFALHHVAMPIGLLLGPLIGGGIATLAGGSQGWRTAFIVMGLLTFPPAIAALFLSDPPRGRGEQLAVTGEVLSVGREPRIPFGVAAERLKRIRSLHFFLMGMAALGFSLVGQITFFFLFVDRQFQLNAFQRGVLGTVLGVGSIAGVPLGGILGDRAFRAGPPRAILLAAGSIVVSGLIFVGGLYVPWLIGFVILMIVSDVIGGLGFVPLSTFVATVTPYRLRSFGFSLVGIYLFVFGGLMGGVAAGLISEHWGPRAALTAIGLPSALVGAALMAWGSRYARHDLSLVVEEIREEHQERARRGETRAEDVPMLQVRNLDFSYGRVQVLFDVALEVRRGEVLALLGTNGAGKSTLLRAISGMGIPDRGVVRLGGRTVTYLDAEQRVEMGIVHVSGGKAIFPSLSVLENLLVGARPFINDRERVRRRIDRSLEFFPALAGRRQQRAGSLSGGEQQMLALAKGLLLEPSILLIDELSLGLAPAVTREVLAVIERLKAEGISMLIVEQSVNVALAVADRAVFLEKGQVRFEGRAAGLLQRPDLLRAVFLGRNGKAAV